MSLLLLQINVFYNIFHLNELLVGASFGVKYLLTKLSATLKSGITGSQSNVKEFIRNRQKKHFQHRRTSTNYQIIISRRLNTSQ